MLIDFVTSLSLSIDWKKVKYNVILIIVDQLTKIIYYKLVKTKIDVASPAVIIINMVIKHHGVFK